jgi:hypothetical protein
VTLGVDASAVKFDVGCTDVTIPMDNALISSEELADDLVIMGVNSQCYKCSQLIILANQSQCSLLWTPHVWTLHLMNRQTGATYDTVTYEFGDQGSYALNAVAGTGDIFQLHVQEVNAPVNSMGPFWTLVGILIAGCVAAFAGPLLYEKYYDNADQHGSFQSTPLLDSDAVENKLRLNDEEIGRATLSSRHSATSLHSVQNDNKPAKADDEDAGRRSVTSNLSSSRHSAHSLADIPIAAPIASLTSTPPSVPAPIKSKPPRLNSLDTFRGFSLCMMIFVNYGGGGYWFLNHAPWDGVTFADLLFPWFMWMMGVSMALSFSALGLIIADPVLGPGAASSIQYSRPHEIVRAPWSAWAKVIQRSITLFCIGLFLNDGSDYKNWRIPGVLQYFGVSYFVTSATVLCFLPSTNVCCTEVLGRLFLISNYRMYRRGFEP